GNKIKIIQETKRLLQVGGRYGIHELCLISDDLDEAKKTGSQSGTIGCYSCRRTSANRFRVIGTFRGISTLDCLIFIIDLPVTC
ncbi:MAG: hypothetical protein AAFV98_21500, partial [Chloroflexota bacterium]